MTNDNFFRYADRNKARKALDKYIKAIGHDKFIYCDTDSISTLNDSEEEKENDTETAL